MEARPSPIGHVTPLALGGGGIGLVWGKSSKEEAIATLRRFVYHHGGNFLDMAPMYGKNRAAEHFVGEAFNGELPKGCQVLTKVYCGNRTPEQIQTKVRDSLEKSLRAMKLQKIDYLICHSNIVPDDWQPLFPATDSSTRWSSYVNGFIPICEDLVREGKIGGWGITGIGNPGTIIRALSHAPRPSVVEVIQNALDALGELKRFHGDSRCREIACIARERGVAVLAIRAVAAGSLCDVIDRPLERDHPVHIQWEKSKKFREIAAMEQMSSASLAHRYSMTMGGDTVVLGVKNCQELDECVEAAKRGPLSLSLMAKIDQALFVQKL